jgi:MFS family permease
MWTLLRSNRDIRWLFVALVISYIGDWFAYVAFVGVVQDVSDASILVTLVLVAQALPAFLMTPIAGPVADRHNRRNVIMTVASVQTLAALALLLVDSEATLWIGYLGLCTISALGAFVGPAAQASIPNLARSPEELQTASVMFGSLWGAMLAVGAALGGLVAGLFGRNVAFIANAASFAIAVLVVSLIRRPMQATRDDESARPRIRPIADMREALGYARRDSTLLSLLASKATFAMGAGVVGLLAVLVTKELGGGDTQTGLIISARGFGVAVGPLLAAPFARTSLGRVLWICGIAGGIWGTAYLGLSVAPTFAIALVLVLIGHLGGGAQWTLSTYGLQARAPDHVRGRILAGDFGMVTLIMTLSNIAAGLLADTIGVRPTIAFFAVLDIAAAATYLVATKPVRERLLREDEPALVSRRSGGSSADP